MGVFLFFGKGFLFSLFVSGVDMTAKNNKKKMKPAGKKGWLKRFIERLERANQEAMKQGCKT